MLEIISALTETKKVPKTGKYYVFVYNPKTPNIQYDQNPLVAVTDVFPWGFRGINFHWGEVRQYTWDEIPGGIYEVAVIAIAFDLDPNFVAFHHIIRLLMILFAVPVILKIIGKKLN